MQNRTKSSLFMFLDYLLSLLLQFFGLFLFSWVLANDWGTVFYSAIFTLVLFGLIYSRAHKAAIKDVKHKELRPVYTEGLHLAAPLAVFNLIIVVLYALLDAGIIPAKDVLVQTLYSFPDNQPRFATEVFLFDYIVPVVRLWFGSLVGFIGSATPALVLLINPAVILAGGFAGYLAGTKKLYISEKIAEIIQKIKEKFNE
ncbi:MAG: hypothetical protein IKL80_01200 [Clostridia bacterium]|nr:hypothetical protein [Clostridia bacterium]